MHLLDFYLKLARFSDFLPVIPILLGLTKWKKLSIGLKCFLGFLIVDLMINFASYNIQGNDNRFLGYFYSFGYCSFILSTYYFFFKDLKEKKIVIFLFFCCLILLLYDWNYISGLKENYFSGILINIVILFTCIVYFSRYFIKKNQHFIEANLFISIVLIFMFFIKIIDEFLDNSVMETQNNATLWIQMRNIYYCFMILSVLATSFILYKYSPNGQKN